MTLEEKILYEISEGYVDSAQITKFELKPQKLAHFLTTLKAEVDSLKPNVYSGDMHNPVTKQKMVRSETVTENLDGTIDYRGGTYELKRMNF